MPGDIPQVLFVCVPRPRLPSGSPAPMPTRSCTISAVSGPRHARAPLSHLASLDGHSSWTSALACQHVTYISSGKHEGDKSDEQDERRGRCKVGLIARAVIACHEHAPRGLKHRTFFRCLQRTLPYAGPLKLTIRMIATCTPALFPGADRFRCRPPAQKYSTSTCDSAWHFECFPSRLSSGLLDADHLHFDLQDEKAAPLGRP